MKKGKFNRKILLLVVLLLITLGYALLSSNLTINGNSKLTNSTWDIHFDNVVPKEGRVGIGENESEAVINPNDNTEVTYNITLSKPGDFYEFNVDIVNAGSIDGQVEKINSSLKIGDDDPFVINSDSSNLPPYLNYFMTYSDDTEIMPNHLLKSGNSETIKVRIEFKRDIDSSILPEDDIDITLTIQPDLIQKNDDGVDKDDNTPVVNSCTYEGELVQGAEYTNGEYTYRYMQEYTGNGWSNVVDDGWGVTLTDKSSTSSVTTNLCTTINDKPIVSMSNMFAGSQASSINTRFNTSSVRNMSGMFSGCSNVEELDLSSFNTGNVSDMSDMFYETDNLVEIKLPVNFIPNAVDRVYLDEMFYDENGYGMNYINRNINSDAPVTIQKKYSLTIENEGMVETTTYSGLYKKGTSITLRAKEQDGLVFTGWSNGETTKEITFVLTEDTTINPIYSYDNVAIFDSGQSINDIMATVAGIDNSGVVTPIGPGIPIDPGIPTESNRNDVDVLDIPTIVGNSGSSLLKHFERSDILIQNIESIVTNMNIEVTEEEIDDYMFHNSDVDRESARKRLIYSKKVQLLGDYLISSYDSGYDIYGWFDEEKETYYYYTEADEIFLNYDSGSFFMNLQDLEDFNGLREVKTYTASNMSNMFYNCSSITHLDLGNFDLSGVGVIDNFLTGADSIKEITTPKVLFSNKNISVNLNNVFLENDEIEHFEINSNTPSRIKIEIEKSAVFDVGTEVNHKMKILAGNDEQSVDPGISYSPMVEQTIVSSTYTPSSNYMEIIDENIDKILRANNLPNNFEATEDNTISASNSYYPIYAWYDEVEKIIYYYTETNKIYFNQDSSYLFSDMSILTDISGVFNVEFSRVKYVFDMFSGCSSMETIDLSNWDFSSIEYVDSSGELIDPSGPIISYSPNMIVSQANSGGGNNYPNEYSISMFMNDDSLKTIITPKKMFNDRRITIILDGKYEDVNHKQYYVINKNTPTSMELSTLVVTIRFNPNGGYVDFDSVRANKGAPIPSLPGAWSNESSFDGWYTAIDGGVLVDENYIVENDIELFARWYKSVEYIEFESKVMDIDISETKQITIQNENEIQEGYTFESSNNNIATVNQEGRVTGIAEGLTIITVRGLKSNKTASLYVNVNQKFNITYNANNGVFDNNTDENFVTYKNIKKYSYTTNREITGEIKYNYHTYGDSYGIIGTDREVGNSQSHVLTISGASKIKIDIYYKVLSTDCNWITIWEGKHPNYSARSNYSSGILNGQKIGESQPSTYQINGYEINDISYESFTIEGDSVTIGYYGNWSANLNPYGYYAIISGVAPDNGEYEEPNNGDTPFDGWDNNSGENVDIDNIYQDMTLYARWRHTVRFNSNGGVVNPLTKTVLSNDLMGELPTPNKNNQHFVGWYTSLEGGEEVTENYVVNSNIEIYARWRNLYELSITFEKNNNYIDGTMHNQTVIEDATTQLNQNEYESDDYNFIGWNTKADGSGISYSDQAYITTNQNITLYAQWIKYCTLTFDKNNVNATGQMDQVKILPGVEFDLTRELFYKFKLDNQMIGNFNIESDNTGISYYKTQKIQLYNDTVLYAHWTDIEVNDVIFWSIQDNDDSDLSETLIISSYEIPGKTIGDFQGNRAFDSQWKSPWYIATGAAGERVKNITRVRIEGIVAPESVKYWFTGVGSKSTLLDLDVTNLYVSYVTDMSDLFSVGGGVSTFNIEGLDKWDTSNVTNMNGMFRSAGYRATTWSIGDLSEWDTSKVEDMQYMFSGSGKETLEYDIGDISDWDTSSVTTMSSMFMDAGYNATTWNIGDLSGWNTSQVEGMSYMFKNAAYSSTSFTLDLSAWNTSKVKYMIEMFEYAGHDATTWSIGNISGWNASQVINMSYMFSNAGYSATTFNLDLNSWKTESVTNISYMFNNTGYNATSYNLNLSGWDTSNVTDMSYLFSAAGYSSSTFSLDISGWNTSQVTNMNHMFSNDSYIYLGERATNWIIKAPQTNGAGISNTTNKLYGSSTSVYGFIPNNRQLTFN